ncbi:MAG: hypothetical protein RL154_981 [Pseudomonadota bacterium]
MRSIVLALFLTLSLFANELYVAAGAGYKRPITGLGALFEKESGVKINPMFGNMAQVGEQIKNSDKISILFGDEDFIEKLKVSYAQKVDLGKGILVLVFAKNDKNYASIKDLGNPNIKKIGLPDTKKAIYGIAADEFLTNTKLKDSLKDKLTVFQTVPQVSSYLISGDIDAGFINKTDYIGIADKVGSVTDIDSKLYAPIKIVGVVISGKENSDTKAFLEFLKSPKAKAILEKFGM